MPDQTKATLSATQIPALFNASPYTTRWSLLRNFIYGDELPNPDHNRLDWGSRLEPLVLAQAAEDLRLEVHPNRGADGKQNYVRRGLLGCTKDATIVCPDRGPGALETKCVFSYDVWMSAWAGGKKPPAHIELQLQQQQYVGDGVTPFNWGVLGVWICGEMKYYERKPIPELWDAFEVEAKKFFDDVAAKREGEPFGDPVEASLLAKVFPLVAAKTVDLSKGDDAHALAADVRRMRDFGDDRLYSEKEEKKLKAKFKGLIKDAEKAYFADGIVITQKQVNRKGFTVAPSSYTTLDAYIPEDVMTGGPQPEETAINVLDAG